MQSLVKRFNSVELLTFTYMFLTVFYIILCFEKICPSVPISNLLLYRLAFSVALFLVVSISEQFANRFVQFIRYIFPFALILYWYPETYSLGGNENGLPQSIIVSNLDGFLDRLDIKLFGCSPAMEFSKALPQALVSEIMYFGYFAYYLIFMIMFIYFFFTRPVMAERAMFYCLCSFFIFYIIFIFVPAAGPQFYYSDIDSQVPKGYIFSSLMRSIQDWGEKPTGAFPSSHVGLTVIAMILLYEDTLKYFYAILPVAIILVASTVYIKAHYLVDVFTAFIIAPFVLALSKSVFGLFKLCNSFPFPGNVSEKAE